MRVVAWLVLNGLRSERVQAGMLRCDIVGGGYGFAGLYRVVGGGFVIHEDFAQVLPVCFTWAVMIASGYFLQTSAS